MSLEKEFVPYQETLELKELGFDEPCFGYFNTTSYLGIGSFVFKECDKNTIDGYGNKPLLRPTFSQAFRFFREKYNLFSSEVYDRDLNNGKFPIINSYSFRILNLNNFEDFYGTIYDTYEEAELACLRELIEIVKTKK